MNKPGKKPFSSDEISQQTYYDKIAAEYNTHHLSYWPLAYRRWVYEHCLSEEAVKGKKVLDALCGGGEASYYFSAAGGQVSAVDISAEQCAIYAKRFPHHKIHCESIHATSFNDEEFDIVVTDSLHHTQPDLKKAIDEILRLLKPGGLLVAWEPAAASFANRLRQTWYRLDPKYFQTNEEAIRVEDVIKAGDGRLDEVCIHYGGGPAYLFVSQALILRISPNAVKVYAPMMLRIEKLWEKISRGKLFPFWVLLVMQKKEETSVR